MVPEEDGWLGWSNWGGSKMKARMRAMGFQHRRGTKGTKPQRGASGTEQRGKTATPIQGAIQGTPTGATGWYVQGEARRRECGAQGWSLRGRQENKHGLDHPEQNEKEEWVKQKPLETHARAGEAGVCRAASPRIRVYTKEGKKPKAPEWGMQNGEERHEGGPTDWSIWGQQAHNAGSSRGREQERSCGDANPREHKSQDWNVMRGKKARGLRLHKTVSYVPRGRDHHGGD